MRKSLYPRLAATNIRKNGRTYLPYLLSSVFTVAVFYIMRSLSLNDGIGEMVGADTIQYCMELGCWIVALFSLIFLFYTNSFIMKNRKREFGLYSILGMEKRHLARVIGYESLYLALLSLGIGLLLGVALDKAMYLLIMNVLGYEITLGFYLSGEAIVTALLLFGIIFLLLYLNALRQVHFAKPVDLLKSQNVGEREPKANWFLALFGIACLGGGYYIAVTIQNPVAAFTLFFVAVLLVIAGTYCLFTAGSVGLLKILKRRKRYYYHPQHFITVSGMIYRMKRNAVGLASICILSTMVLVIVSSTTSMMVGVEDILHTRYPYDLSIYSFETDPQREEALETQADQTVKAAIPSAQREIAYTYLTFSAQQEGNCFITDQESVELSIDKICNLFFIPLSDYCQITGEEIVLDKGEVLLYSNRVQLEGREFTLFDQSYHVVRRLEHFIGNGMMSANIASSHFMVVADDALPELDRLQQQEYGENASVIRRCLGYRLEGETELQVAAYESLVQALKEQEFQCKVESLAFSRPIDIGVYGGLFFMGIFLGVLFLMATILIIYYKQVSEGYEDRERFLIMQKVGLSPSEVKKSIHSQIITVFFLPLITAGVHVAFAFPMIEKILGLLGLVNIPLYLLCTCASFLIFAIFYCAVYGMTAKVYYRLVRR